MFVGKLHIFSRFWGEELSLALGGFPNTNSIFDENIDHVPPESAQECFRCSLLLARSTVYWHEGTLVAMAKAHSEKRTTGPKARKTVFHITDATYNTKHG